MDNRILDKLFNGFIKVYYKDEYPGLLYHLAVSNNSKGFNYIKNLPVLKALLCL